MSTAFGRSAALGRIGIWSSELRTAAPDTAAQAAGELEALGFGALWVPGGIEGDLLERMGQLLAVTSTVTLATGILNIWKHRAADVGLWFKALSPGDRARILIGLGVSHGPVIGADYRRPIATMAAYLDDLDAAELPIHARCLAALGPKMLELARDRTAGADPYLTTSEHTASARATLGVNAVLAPEQGVILETNPQAARAIAASALKIYLTLPNYVHNWRRLGFSDEDFAGPSERLLDALFAWGDTAAIKARVDAHFAAGADHVCLQVIRTRAVRESLPVAQWRALAAALLQPSG
jgi:probable F420-dependent oxidoreductase